jgi:hypothetical protein
MREVKSRGKGRAPDIVATLVDRRGQDTVNKLSRFTRWIGLASMLDWVVQVDRQTVGLATDRATLDPTNSLKRGPPTRPW